LRDSGLALARRVRYGPSDFARVLPANTPGCALLSHMTTYGEAI